MQVAAKITRKGRVTIPYAIRNEAGLQTDDTVFFEVKGDEVIMRKPKNLMNRVGFLGKTNLPDDEELLLN